MVLLISGYPLYAAKPLPAAGAPISFLPSPAARTPPRYYPAASRHRNPIPFLVDPSAPLLLRRDRDAAYCFPWAPYTAFFGLSSPTPSKVVETPAACNCHLVDDDRRPRRQLRRRRRVRPRRPPCELLCYYPEVVPLPRKAGHFRALLGYVAGEGKKEGSDCARAWNEGRWKQRTAMALLCRVPCTVNAGGLEDVRVLSRRTPATLRRRPRVLVAGCVLNTIGWWFSIK